METGEIRTQVLWKPVRQKKPEKPPALVVMDSTIKTLRAIMGNANILKESYTLKTESKKFIRLQTKNMDDYKATIQLLVEQKIEFFNNTPKSDKLKTRVFKGITGGFDTADIEKALKEENIPEVTLKKVVKMSRQDSTNFARQYSTESHQS